MNLARKIKRHKDRGEIKRAAARRLAKPVERLTAVAIKRHGKVIEGGQGSHWRIRFGLDPKCDPDAHVAGDVEGFIVAPSGRFVDRVEAYQIALAAGQCPKMERMLLSSDVRW